MEKIIEIVNDVILNTDTSKNSVVTSEEFCLHPSHTGSEILHGLLIDGWPTYWSLDQIRQGYRNSNASLAARFGTRLDGKLLWIWSFILSNSATMVLRMFRKV